MLIVLIILLIFIFINLFSISTPNTELFTQTVKVVKKETESDIDTQEPFLNVPICRFILRYYEIKEVFKEFPHLKSINLDVKEITYGEKKVLKFYSRYVNLFIPFEEEINTVIKFIELKKNNKLYEDLKTNKFSFIVPNELMEPVIKKFPFVKTNVTLYVNRSNSHTQLVIPFYKYEHLKILRFIETFRLSHGIDWITRI
jgi:hypothetical protein